MTRRRYARSGFTLIELVVVLFIIAVATAVTVPALLGEPRDDAMTLAAREVETLFRMARDSAVSGGTPVTVAIDSATARVWLFAGNDMAAADALNFGLPDGVRLQLSRARATFVFSPGGATFADSLVLTSALSERLITIDPWTGHARID